MTARAKELLVVLRLKPNDKLCSAFRKIGEENGSSDWGIGDVYYGSIVEWIIQSRKGIRKFKNFEILQAVDMSRTENVKPDYIFIGDTGEKDEEAAERIIKAHKNMKAVFLHVVSSASDRSKLPPIPQDRKFDGVPIYYFRTYVGAAVKAARNGLISKDGLLRVMSRAESDLLINYPKSKERNPPSMLESKWKEIEADIAEIKYVQ